MIFKIPRFLMAAMIVLSALAMGCSGSKTAPKEIIGVWKTQAQDSAGVSIEITANKIIISSDLGVVENTITKVETQKGHLHNSKLFAIYYSARAGETNLMNVLYSPEEGGVIRFKSEQDMIWKRSP